MAFDQVLAQRIGDRLAGPAVTGKVMFGRFMFLLDGRLALGVTGTDLLVRVGRDHVQRALEEPGARPSDMGGRRMAGWVIVDGSALADDRTLDDWIGRARLALGES